MRWHRTAPSAARPYSSLHPVSFAGASFMSHVDVVVGAFLVANESIEQNPANINEIFELVVLAWSVCPTYIYISIHNSANRSVFDPLQVYNFVKRRKKGAH